MEGSILVIRLESGLTVRLPAKYGKEKWDSVEVAYDYTHNRAVEVITNDEETDVLDEVEIFDEEEMPEPVNTDEGALYPVSDEVEDSWVLEPECDGECQECPEYLECWVEGLRGSLSDD